jgi:hypothetical protein
MQAFGLIRAKSIVCIPEPQPMSRIAGFVEVRAEKKTSLLYTPYSRVLHGEVLHGE